MQRGAGQPRENRLSFRSATIRCSSSCQGGLQPRRGHHRFQDLPLEEGPQILKAKGAVRQKEEQKIERIIISKDSKEERTCC